MRARVSAIGPACCACLVVSLRASSAFGQTADESARAEKLFAEAMGAIETGNYEEACPKLAESERLEPALGTQYNLALCYEKIGRLGSAWQNMVAVDKLARATGKKGREEAAREKLAELRPKVQRLVIRTAEGDVTVKIDGELVDPKDYAFYAVDPGKHAVDATAPTKRPWHADVVVADILASEVAVDVPPLATMPGKTVTIQKETTNGKRVAGFVIGAIGVVGVSTGVVTGLMILHAKSKADGDCKPTCADQSGRDAVGLGKTLLPINAVAWGVGFVGLGVGSYLLFTSPSKERPVSTTLAPIAAPGFAGVSWSGSF